MMSLRLMCAPLARKLAGSEDTSFPVCGTDAAGRRWEIPTTLICFHDCPHYFSDILRDDGIAKGAQFSHSLGYPMSQQTNVGFNAPPSDGGVV